MTRTFFDDDRALMVPVAHVMTIAITTVLIAMVMVSATAMLENERESTTRAELETVGNRIAADIGRLDSLASDGAKTNLTSKHTDRIAGSRYTVSLAEGATCDTGTSSSKWCLELESVEHDVVQYVPIHNDTEIQLQSEPDGVVHLSAESDGSSARSTLSDSFDLDTRLGIGQDVAPNGVAVGNQPGNRPPVAKFTFRPGSPQDGQAVTFDASAAYDPDGSIDKYLWDFNGDGTYDEVTSDPTIDHTLVSGSYDVELRVDDDEGAWSNSSQFVDVSGLVYNDDLDTDGGDDNVKFTLRNNFGRSIEITHILVDPADDSIDDVDNGGADTIEIDGSNDGYYSGNFYLPDGGRILQLTNSAEMDPGSTATVSIRGFDGSVAGQRMDIGIQYDIGGTPNSTRFADVPGGPRITNYDLVASGTDVDLRFESSEQLTSAAIEIGGDASETLDVGDLTESAIGSGYRYTYDVSGGSAGYFWANMTAAESSGGPSGEVPLNASAVTVTSGLSWSSSGDWDAADSSSGIVHAAFGDHQADRLELGYPTEDQNGDNLVGYWPLDDPSTAPDVSSTGNDGSVNGDPGSALGIFGSTSYSLDGNDDYVLIPDSESIDMSDEDTVTVSAWVRPESRPGTWNPIFQHSDQGYNLQFEDRAPAFTIYDGGWTTAKDAQYPDGQWYHIAGVFDGDDTRIYVDGQPGPVVDGADEVESGGMAAGLGANLDASGRYLDGQVDEVRVYDRALSDGEVFDLYDTATSGSLVTDWKSSTGEIDGGDVELQYGASIDTGETVAVTVWSRDGGTVETSSEVELSDGAGTVDVPGLAQSADEYRLAVEMGSNSPLHAPDVSSLAVVDGS